MRRFSAALRALDVAAVALAIASAAGTRSAGAQQAGAPAQNVTISLGSGAVAGVLPFDQPVTLSGAAGESLVAVRLFYAPAKDWGPTTCREYLKANPPKTPLADSAPHPLPAQWRTASWTQPGVKVPADSFRLRLRPLRANEEYTLCLRLTRRLSKDDSTRFAAGAAGRLFEAAATLAAQYPDGFPDTTKTPGVSAIRAAQRLLLDALPSADLVVVADSSLLDARASLERVSRQLAPLYTFAKRSRDRATQFESAAGSVSGAIVRLGQVHGGLLGRLGAARPKRGTDAETARLAAVGSFATGLAGIASNASAAAAAARGTEPFDPRQLASSSRPVVDDVDTALVRDRLRNLDSTRKAFDALGTLVSDLRAGPPALRAEYALAPADVQGLPALADSLGTARRLLTAHQATLELWVDALTSLRGSTQRLGTSLATYDLPAVALVSSTSGDYVTRARWHISADIGVLYGTRIGQAVTPYAGANFYFVPVNKQMPVWHCPRPFLECVGKVTSVTVGLTTNSVARDGRTANLFASNAALAGVGVRLTDYLRVSGGALFLRRVVDAATNETRVTARPAYGVSIDIDVRDLLGPFGSLLPK